MFLRCLIVSILLVMTAKSKLRKEDTLDDRVHRLTELNKKDTIIRLKGDRFRRYVEAGPRNYSIIIMLTASQSERKCPVCKEAEGEYQIVANSWRSSKEYSNHMFFTLADVDEAPDVYQHLRLNMAPVFVHYPSKGKPKKSDVMEIHRYGFAAEQIARFVAERTQILIRIARPPNYTSTLALGLLLSVVAALIYVKRDSLKLFFDPTGWAVSVLMMIFAMTSGQMWNHILGPPLMHKDPRTGEKHYIYADFQGQFVMESYIVIFLQVAIVVGFILLNEACFLKRDQTTKRIVALSGLGIVGVFFFLLLCVFKIKHIGYPYSLMDILDRGFWSAIVAS